MLKQDVEDTDPRAVINKFTIKAFQCNLFSYANEQNTCFETKDLGTVESKLH